MEDGGHAPIARLNLAENYIHRAADDGQKTYQIRTESVGKVVETFIRPWRKEVINARSRTYATEIVRGIVFVYADLVAGPRRKHITVVPS